MDRALVAALAARLDRRVAFSVSITDRELYLSIGEDTLTGAVTKLRSDAAAINHEDTKSSKDHEEEKMFLRVVFEFFVSSC